MHEQSLTAPATHSKPLQKQVNSISTDKKCTTINTLKAHTSQPKNKQTGLSLN